MKKVINKRFFIAFEGNEGCGKTTQIKLFTNYLKERQIDYLLTREPGGTEIGEEVRKILLDPKNKGMFPETEAYLYASSRAQLVREVIRPALELGKLVITDRYVDSSLIYQGIGRDLQVNIVRKLNEFAIDGLLPHICFVILVKPEIGLERAKKESIKSGFQNGDRLENEKLDFHNKIYDGFKALGHYRKNIYFINGERSPKEVFSEIRAIFDKNYGSI
ncbi:dTMP kinase [bacterium]|nr:dTMP kinase [bacterium]